MSDSPLLLARLRHSLAPVRPPANDAADLFTLGADGVDARLGGGLTRAGLHEVFATQAGDAAAANGFALMLALRASKGARNKAILWIRGDSATRRYGRLYAPGLIELGADPDDVILVLAPDDLAALRAGSDCLACSGIGAVILEICGKARAIDLTTTRRLVLGAARSGVMALLVRSEAEPQPNAATTRWQVASAPSLPLEGSAPGHSRLAVTLLRQRNGRPGFETYLEWNRDEQIFNESANGDAALSGAVSAVATRGPDQTQWRLAG